jgi:hypothetical protein
MHTCACIISFTVHTDQHPVWGQPFQPGDGCILFNSHNNCLFEQLRAGKFFSQLFEEEIPVGIPSGDDIVVDVVGGNLFVRKSFFLNTLNNARTCVEKMLDVPTVPFVPAELFK